MPAYERRVNADAGLTGRNLEPWRALLAIALWLDEKGVAGLWQRMEQLSRDYQTERTELEFGNFTVLVINALCHLAISAISAISREGLVFNTAQLAEVAAQLEDESFVNIEGEKGETGNESDEEKKDRKTYLKRLGRRVGITLGKLRLGKIPRPTGRGSRLWKVRLDELERLTATYGLPFSKELQNLALCLPENGKDGKDGKMAYEQGELPNLKPADTLADDANLLVGEL